MLKRCCVFIQLLALIDLSLQLMLVSIAQLMNATPHVEVQHTVALHHNAPPLESHMMDIHCHPILLEEHHIHQAQLSLTSLTAKPLQMSPY